MISPWVNDGKATPRRRTRAVSAKFFGAKTLIDHEVDCRIVHLPLGPQIRDGKSQTGPAP
jgi:hypothetical protein